ncbi:uncharacterized protein LOC112526039 isoform X1 [Cynara cardunculus var. scolymus]|uniref:uncharacterized protein LOC112526039 isoform X1 n=1 Tax=Cynara cardunculus var. scolymus TaxID=59895 RepID=UPI000D628A0C|nr:uncharacterized protein LOC112526039 isoform X1 [Cynara cardunculus var. scolymus]
MGKVGGATTAKKKKGRPSLVDLKKRALEQQELENHQQSQRRSARRNPNSVAAVDDASVDEDEYYEDDDDDERKEKKVKLVVRLPQLNQERHLSSDLVRSSSVNSVSGGSDSNADVDNRKINSGSGGIPNQHQGGKVPKAMDTLHASPLEAGPTTPLPDKKLLVFILDRLQKKDTHGVFSEPVDPNELPDYHEIIDQPMDFGTVRSKLDKGLYSNLEELEADVYLICSNAMQYNPSDTVFFRQARSIQELAKRDFENLRQEGDDGELQPKVVKRGRPPSKHLKKPPGRPPLDVVGPESTSGATLATAIDNPNESTPYNLRRGPMVYKHQADGSHPSHRSRNGEQHSELLSDWNEEFPAQIKRADMKYGNKHFNIDETRRDTYKQFHPSNYGHNHSLLSNFGGERKQLVAVGLHAEHGYARSLARFAANMGPVVWKIASKKIEKVLPPGVTFAPGVVGEPEPSPPPTSFFPSGNQSYTPRLASDDVLNKPEPPSTSGPKNVIAEAETSEPKIEVSALKANKLPPNHGRNGLNGANVSKMGMFGLESDGQKATIGGEMGGNGGKASWQQVSSSNHRPPFTVPIPPDLNGSPPAPGSVGLRMGSPSAQQPDLALQL